MSLIIPFSTGVRTEIQSVAVTFQATKKLKTALLEKWKKWTKYLLPYETKSTTCWATLLDVRFQNPASFSTYSNYTAAYESLKEELIKMRAPKKSVVEQEAPAPAPVPPKKPELPTVAAKSTFGILRHVKKTTGPIASSSKPKNNPREVIVLLNTFMNIEPEPYIMVDDDSIKKSILSNYLIEYWKNYCQFPELQSLAEKILFVPSSSASSERTCSAAAYIISNRRSRLTADHAAKIIIYVNRNKEFTEY